MNAGLPDWAEVIDRERDYLPIVCTGGTAARHPVELIGVAQDCPHPFFADRPMVAIAVRDRYIELTLAEGPGPFNGGTITDRIMFDSMGSAVITCPVCTRVHRTKRQDFMRFLAAARWSLAWADVSVLD